MAEDAFQLCGDKQPKRLSEVSGSGHCLSTSFTVFPSACDITLHGRSLWCEMNGEDVTVSIEFEWMLVAVMQQSEQEDYLGTCCFCAQDLNRVP